MVVSIRQEQTVTHSGCISNKFLGDRRLLNCGFRNEKHISCPFPVGSTMSDLSDCLDRLATTLNRGTMEDVIWLAIADVLALRQRPLSIVAKASKTPSIASINAIWSVAPAVAPTWQVPQPATQLSCETAQRFGPATHVFLQKSGYDPHGRDCTVFRRCRTALSAYPDLKRLMQTIT